MAHNPLPPEWTTKAPKDRKRLVIGIGGAALACGLCLCMALACG